MKFATALIAIGAQAVKLHQEDGEDYLIERAVAMHRIIDWNGSGTVDGDEIKDLAYAADAFGYIEEGELDQVNADIDEFMDAMGGPFDEDDLVGVLEEADEELLEEMVEGLECAEEMIIDFAVGAVFDAIDTNDNGEIEVEEVEDMIAELELEDDADEVYEGFEAADVDEDWVVDVEEFYDAMWYAIEEDAELRRDIMEEAADFIDMFDIECEGDYCDEVREMMKEEIDELAAELDDEDDE